MPFGPAAGTQRPVKDVLAGQAQAAIARQRPPLALRLKEHSLDRLVVREYVGATVNPPSGTLRLPGSPCPCPPGQAVFLGRRG